MTKLQSELQIMLFILKTNLQAINRIVLLCMLMMENAM